MSVITRVITAINGDTEPHYVTRATTWSYYGGGCYAYAIMPPFFLRLLSLIATLFVIVDHFHAFTISCFHIFIIIKNIC